MDVVGTPASSNSLSAEFASPNEHGAESRARYQPLVVAMLSVAAGMVLDRYGRPLFFPQSLEWIGGDAWFVVWWCLCAGCLAIWWLSWRGRRQVAAA